MKKIFITAGIAASAAAFAQSAGKVGVNTDAPQATLDIRPNDANALATATTNEGVLIPKLSAARVGNIAAANRIEGTLVYVTDAPSGALFSDTTKGFYYWNSTANTTGQWVKMGSGGTAAAEGSFTRNIRTFSGPTETATKNDYFLIYNGSGTTAVTLPNDAANGQTICVYNGTTDSDVGFSPALKGAFAIAVGQVSVCVIKYGADWYPVTGN